jgi:DNA-binding IscR family transcriptional regulator
MNEKIYAALGRKMEEPRDVQIAKQILERLTDTPQNVSQLATELNVQLPYMHGIVHKLRRASLVACKRGRNGGVYRLPTNVEANLNG